jgi:hypothetical protein
VLDVESCVLDVEGVVVEFCVLELPDVSCATDNAAARLTVNSGNNIFFMGKSSGGCDCLTLGTLRQSANPA